MFRNDEQTTTVPRRAPRGGAAPADPRPKLRLGVFADARRQPRWLVEAVARAAGSPFAELVLVAASPARRVDPPVWRLWHRIERRAFGRGPDPSQPVDLDAGLRGAPLAWLPGGQDGPAAWAAWRAGVRALQLDVAIALGEVDALGLESLARCGVWRYAFGEAREADERTAGWQETVSGQPVTHSALVARVPGESGERIVYRSSSMTFPYSVARNRENVLRKASCYLERGLAALHREGPAWLAACPHVATRAAAPLPGRTQLAAAAGRLALRIAGRALQKAVAVDQWVLAYRFGAPDWEESLDGYTRLLPPRSGFWADPFPLVREGRHYIFFEDFRFASAKGSIAVVEVFPRGGSTPPETVLERGYHLSYPFLLEQDGELFMVPESGENATVELYRCLRFPNRWRLETTLLRDARYLDATLHRGEDRWWMFVNVGVPGTDGHDELHLYHAERLTGPWRPHARNPVKSDARSARPAGRLYLRGGALYRPSQVCGPLYGSGVSLNRVLRLTPEHYAEREEHGISAARVGDALGVHTVNRAGDLSVIDLFLRRARLGLPGMVRSGPIRPPAVHGTVTKAADN